jgi:hypothetical protein
MASFVELVVPNLADFNLSQVGAHLDPSAIAPFSVVAKPFADQAVFWSSESRVLILYPGVDPRWLADVHESLDQPVPPALSPPERTGQLIPDLLHDSESLERLRSCLGSSRQVRLLSWGATPDLYVLMAAIQSWGHQVKLDVPAEDRYWTVPYLDSKLCCADLAAQISGVRIPRSWTVTNWTELRGVIGMLASGKRRVVVKAIHGAGGAGCVFSREGELDLDRIWQAVADSPFLRVFPIVVQEFIPHEPQTSCHAVDMRIGARGIERTVTSRAGADGYQILRLSDGVCLLDPPLENRMHAVARRLGRAAHGLGFRGWIGADFIVGTDGKLYLLELNARRTGGMHAVGLLSAGGPQAGLVAVSHDAIELPHPGPLTYEDVRPVFQRMWAAGRRVYPTTVRDLCQSPPQMGIVTLAASTADACRLADQLVRSVDRQVRGVQHPPQRTGASEARQVSRERQPHEPHRRVP